MTHNESINFLIENGWEYDKNRPANKRFFRTVNDFNDEFEYVSMEDALEYTRWENPGAFSEFELLDNLDTKFSTMVSQYNDE
jgi:hypothetical protein